MRKDTIVSNSQMNFSHKFLKLSTSNRHKGDSEKVQKFYKGKVNYNGIQYFFFFGTILETITQMQQNSTTTQTKSQQYQDLLPEQQLAEEENKTCQLQLHDLGANSDSNQASTCKSRPNFQN